MMETLRTLLLLLVVLPYSVGCDLTAQAAKDTAVVAGTAVFDSTTAALVAFRGWAPKEIDSIEKQAISACKDRLLPAEYAACTQALIAPRRKLIDDVVAAAKVYADVGGTAADLADVFAASALADLKRTLASAHFPVAGGGR
jgi:hypothetical protein